MSDEQIVEFDVEALIGGNVPSIVAKLSDLSDNQLVQLEAAERAQDKPRTGVVEAIEAEMLGRVAADSAGDPPDPVLAQVAAEVAAAQADGAAAQAARIALLEDICSAISSGLLERELVGSVDGNDLAGTVFIVIDDLVFNLDVSKGRIADLEGAVADGQAKAAAKGEKPVAMQVAANLPDLSGLDEVRVRCVDADDVTVPGLPPLIFMPHQFEREGDGYVLDAAIAFPRESPESEVTALFLTIKGKSGLRAAFVQPISIGGGKSIELPRGHVRFVAAAAG